jgi:superfamily II DNA/RNA helicase
MSMETLQQWLLANQTFITRVNEMLIESVAGQFPNLERFTDYYNQKPDWPYLLFCASLLCQSQRPAAEEAALRIAQSAILNKDCTKPEKAAAALLLDELSNRRAIELAQGKGLLEREISGKLGVAASIDWTRRTLEHSILFRDGRTLYANRFQRELWNELEEVSWVSASAPTSAGKSYIILQWLTQFCQERERCTIVYLVPTRALIQQVDRDLRMLCQQEAIEDLHVETVPFHGSSKASPKRVLVFTQERLHYHLSTGGDTDGIDAIIVDEAHKIGDKHRGVLLQHVIERVADQSPKVQVIFASPLADNPEELLADAPQDAQRRAVANEDVTVNQNLLWLDVDPAQPTTWTMSLCLPGQRVPIGLLHLEKRLSTAKRKLAQLTVACDTGEGGNLVYVNRAYDAEQTAEELCKAIPEAAVEKGELDGLAELSRTVVHGDYALARCAKKGVAFHYGNMPLILRTEIERLFTSGAIRFLVCTSTLVEGVNLPCRNLVVRGPKKGSEHMDSADFWNLAGRAGRWGKDFQGNIICVDARVPDVWGNGAPFARGRYRVQRTTDRVLRDSAELTSFLRADTPRDVAETRPDLEFVSSYLAATSIRFGSLLSAPWAARLPQESLRTIAREIDRIVADLQVPRELVVRHIGVSPIAMGNLLGAMRHYPGPAEDLLVPHPREEDSARQYAKIFELIGHHVSPVFGNGGRALALAILTREWMLGLPMSRLIATRIRRKKPKPDQQEIDTIIRKTLEDVEEVARFQAPKHLSCYSDILSVFLAESGREDLRGSQVDLTLMLEFGVPGGTQLSLMGLGLSRATANLLVTEFAKPVGEAAATRADLTSLDDEQAREWLMTLAVEEGRFPAAITREIVELQQRLLST